MPSFWSCFNIRRRQHTFARQKDNRRCKDRTEIHSVVENGNEDIQETADPEIVYPFSGHKISHFETRNEERNNDNTMTKLIDSPKTNKRRHIREIFSSLSKSESEKVFRESDRVFPGPKRAFSESRRPFYSPNKSVDPEIENLESMRVYVPKVIQNVLTSTALEGQRVDDYLSKCRPSIALDKFASAEMCQHMDNLWNQNRSERKFSIIQLRNKMDENSFVQSPDYNSNSSEPCQPSEQTTSESDYVTVDDASDFEFVNEQFVLAHCQSNMINEESIFVCDGEVLY